MNLRRRLLCAFGAGWGVAPMVAAQHLPVDQLLQAYIGTDQPRRGRVQLTIAALTDNGFSVALKVAVDSPMTEQDHVRSLLLLSNRNPRPLIAAFEFGLGGARPSIATRVRLAGSQTVFALAQTSDGQWWLDQADVEVTESACLDQT